MPTLDLDRNQILDSAQEVLEAIVERFERAWRAKQRPRIEDYFPSYSASDQPILIELIHSDLEYRLKVGDSARVEEYLDRFPELAGDDAVISEFVQTEFTVRQSLHLDPCVEEYQRRFPQLQNRLGLASQSSTIGTIQAPPGLLSSSVSTKRESRTAPPDLLSGEPDRMQSFPPHAVPEVAGYHLLELLGCGAMGVVYKARDLRLQRLVALKMVRTGDPTENLYRERFQREAELIARLHHPNIVEVFEVGEAGGQTYLALEYVDGGSLDRRIAGSPQPAREAAELVLTLAGAMHAAHQAGIVHRDLKPVNVLLTRAGTPKITDFGLAKHLGAESAQTHNGVIVGTPSYMAPEQAAGRAREAGPPTDVYALGAILYELLTGRPPFRAETVFETLEQVRDHDPVPPGRLLPKLARDLETICLKCLQKEPHNRYPNAQELADDLRRFLQGEPVQARPIPPWERAWKWARRRPAVAGCLVASLIAAVSLIAGVALWGQFQQQRAYLAEQELAKHAVRAAYQREVAALVQRGQQELVAGRPREAQLRLSEVLAKRGQLPAADFLDALLLRGLVNGELGEFDAAEADFQTALAALDPGTPACYPVFVNRGLVRFRRGALADAEADLREAIRLKPDEIMAYANLAQVYQKQKRWDDALAQLDRAIQLRPDLPLLYRSRARLQLRRLDPSAALRDLDEAIRLDSPAQAPALAEDYTEKGRILFHQQRRADAQAMTARALEAVPEYAPAFQLRGELLLAEGQAAQALACFDTCVQKGLRSQAVFFGRGQARATLGELIGAIDDYSRALELQADAVTFAQRGWLYLFCEAPKVALADFQQAIELEPRNHDAISGRSLAYVRLGRFREAVADAEHAVQLDANGARTLYNAACVYSQVAGRPVTQDELLGTDALPSAEDCQDLALKLLHQATKQVVPDQRQRYSRDYLAMDPDLKPIRSTPGFARLLAELARSPE